MPLPTDRERELILRDVNDRALCRFIKLNLAHLGGRKCRFDKFLHVFAPFDNVNLLTTQFVDNRLHACSFLSDTRADRVHSFFRRKDGEFGSRTRFAGNSLNLDHSRKYFRHLKCKEMSNHFRMSARKRDTGTLRIRLNAENIDFDSLTDTIILPFHLFRREKCAHGFSQIDKDDATVNTLNDTIHDGSFFTLVFGKHTLSLRLADTLNNHLLRRLRRDTPKFLLRLERNINDVSHIHIRLHRARLLEGNVTFAIEARESIFIHFIRHFLFTLRTLSGFLIRRILCERRLRILFLDKLARRFINHVLHKEILCRLRHLVEFRPNHLSALPIILLVRRGKRRFDYLHHFVFGNTLLFRKLKDGTSKLTKPNRSRLPGVLLVRVRLIFEFILFTLDCFIEHFLFSCHKMQ